MTPDRDHEPQFSFDHGAAFQRLRGVLDGAGFTEKGILEALKVADFPSMRQDDLALLLWRTNGGTPLETLIRLFLINVPVAVEAARDAFATLPLEKLVTAGLVRIEGSTVRASVKLLPYQQLVVAFDLPQRLATGQAHDYVMGIGQSSITLANLTLRRPVRRTLDLGTGCGIQALLCARHSDEVVAVDRNPRAVQLAAFNAKLNGMAHVQCLPGDFFEPVRGQRFDLVVANPPFVISPEMRYLYRDSGLTGDQVCRQIAQQVPAYLEEGGFAQILCNWAERSDSDWREHLAEWFSGSGCDVWVLRSETRDVATYASAWIRHTESFVPADQSMRFEQWMGYYRSVGIEAVSAGLMTLRRRSGSSHWYRADDAPLKMIGPCGDFLGLGFALRDFLEAHHDDQALLECDLRVSPDVRLEQTLTVTEDQWSELAAQLYLARGLAYTGNVDALIAELLARCNGQRRLRDLLTDLAAALEMDPSRIETAACAIVRQLVQRGFLLPPGIGDVAS